MVISSSIHHNSIDESINKIIFLPPVVSEFDFKNNMNIEEKNIILIGQSLGTGIVIDYVSKNKWDSPIILISPYKSIISVVCDSSIVKPIDKFQSLKKIKSITCPVKIFHGKEDKTI